MAEGRVSLLHGLREQGYDCSVICTYNCYLPFYEEVVLRRLRAAGCQYNVVLMDARQLAACMASPSSRPRWAGLRYTLLPVRARGAFHPKLMMMLGKRGGRVNVGSHNLTLSGFGCNRELTNVIHVGKADPPEARQVALDAWRLMRSWIDDQPDVLREAVDEVVSTASWLRRVKSSSGPQLLGSTRDGPSLWAQLSASIADPIVRIVVVGPFFDASLKFLRMLRERFGSAELIVGIEPERVQIAAAAAQALDGVRFVDSGGLAGTNSYLHAKALVFTADSGRELVVTGSANPSAPAWTADAVARNIEVVLARWEDDDALSGALGLGALATAPPITDAGWAAIAERLSDAKEPPSDAEAGTEDEASHRLRVAVDTANGIEVLGWAEGEIAVTGVRLLDGEGGEVGRAAAAVSDGSRLVLAVEESVRRATVLVEICHNEVLFIATVHHPNAIEPAGRRSSRAALRRALGELESDTPDLAAMLTLVNKVIFAEVPFASVGGPRTGTTSDAGDNGTEHADEVAPTTLAGEAKSGRRKRRSRLVKSGELGYLLDALIHELGRGLAAERNALPTSEEELVDSDEAAALSPPGDEVDGAKLAKACRSKIARLVKRLVEQLEVCRSEGGSTALAIARSAAVLSIVTHIVCRERLWEWVPLGERLVHERELFILFFEVSQRLFAPKVGLDVEDNEDAETEELATCIEHLLWLSAQFGFDVRDVQHHYDERFVPELKWRSRLALLSARVGDAHVAQAWQRVQSACRPSRLAAIRESWRANTKWMRNVAAVATMDTATAASADALSAGDIACVAASDLAGRPVVVGRVHKTVELVDPCQLSSEKLGSAKWMAELPCRVFGRAYVRRLAVETSHKVVARKR